MRTGSSGFKKCITSQLFAEYLIDRVLSSGDMVAQPWGNTLPAAREEWAGAGLPTPKLDCLCGPCEHRSEAQGAAHKAPPASRSLHEIAENALTLAWELASLSSLGWADLFLFSSVQSLSCVQLFATPWAAARQDTLSITNSWSLLKLMSTESVMPSNHLILSRPHLLLPSIFPSIRVFSHESALCIRWPKYWSFSFNISNEYSGLISFRMDWLNFLAVQGTLKSLLQHHSSKASVLQRSALFIVQLSHPYMTTGKTIALTRWTFVGKVMSLLFNMLSRVVITFLPRSKRL